MIRVKDCATNILADCEILNNIIEYIRQNVGKQDWQSHTEDISGYIAAGIKWHEDEVIGYMNSKLYSKIKWEE